MVKAAWQCRLAFFRDGQDIGQWSALMAVAQSLNLDSLIQLAVDDGSAYAALWRDQELKEKYKIEGSPTYYLNQGRQKLFGNVGYNILDANVQELLQNTTGDASWC